MIAAIVVAGGSGERFGAAGGKQLAPLGGAPMLGRTVAALVACGRLDHLVVVADPSRIEEYAAAAESLTGDARPPLTVVPGGETRQESVRIGLAAVPAHASIVLVHDGARPLVTAPTVLAAIEALESDPGLDGVVCGHPAVDTVKAVDAEGTIMATLDRSHLWSAQTPQVFRAVSIRRAHEIALREGFSGTDDASLVERSGGGVRMLISPKENIKVTEGPDMLFAEAVLAAREGSQ